MQIIKNITFVLLAGVLASQSCFGDELKKRVEVEINEVRLQLEYCMNQKMMYQMIKDVRNDGDGEPVIENLLNNVKALGELWRKDTLNEEGKRKIIANISIFRHAAQMNIKAFMAAQKAWFWLCLKHENVIHTNNDVIQGIYKKVLSSPGDSGADTLIFNKFKSDNFASTYNISWSDFEHLDPLIIGSAVLIAQAKQEENHDRAKLLVELLKYYVNKSKDISKALKKLIIDVFSNIQSYLLKISTALTEEETARKARAADLTKLLQQPLSKTTTPVPETALTEETDPDLSILDENPNTLFGEDPK
ncbi:MAG: hypothetical protein US49_C0001G0211 [candidate division TM6 bacterium GW2011_GWF2_37_49]|nr:MAG: hypothetical protein US49_C0001G0211 [candidate division TM6 bacterium GW2011_GWF2_37_49]